MKRFYKFFAVAAIVVTFVAALAIGAEATELKTGIGSVTASSLRLRAKNNTEAEILTTASYGDQVVVLRQVGDWYLVDYNLYIGYMHADYVTVKDRENIDLGKGSINPAVVNMRSGPSTSNSAVTQVSSSQLVDIIGFNCDWYKVIYNGQTGYIRSDLVTLTEKPATNTGSACPTAGVAASNSSSTAAASSSAPEAAPTVSNTSTAQQIVEFAKRYIGYPYVWGGTSPAGFDCSGFTTYVYKQFGYSLNRTANAQASNGYAVSKADLAPGDLVLFTRTYSSSVPVTHVGIYIGNGQFIHAANSSTGVVISSLSEGYYSSRYYGARRIA